MRTIILSLGDGRTLGIIWPHGCVDIWLLPASGRPALMVHVVFMAKARLTRRTAAEAPVDGLLQPRHLGPFCQWSQSGFLKLLPTETANPV